MSDPNEEKSTGYAQKGYDFEVLPAWTGEINRRH